MRDDIIDGSMLIWDSTNQVLIADRDKLRSKLISVLYVRSPVTNNLMEFRYTGNHVGRNGKRYSDIIPNRDRLLDIAALQYVMYQTSDRDKDYCSVVEIWANEDNSIFLIG